MPHLVLGDAPGGDVGAKLLQRVHDLAPWADGDGAVQDGVQVVDAGILGAEEEGGEEGRMSVRADQNSPRR